MKRNIIYAVIVSFLICWNVSSIACTTFLLSKNGKHVFGRNYDWVTGNGMVCTNLRGLAKTSSPDRDGGTISWVSKYGSITFNQYGKEFPTGGMNEKGLVVELMWLDGTKYPAKDNRPAIDVLQWIQYQLDNCTTVEDVIASDNQLRIGGQNPPLHYLIADGSGKAATIEFLDGKMVVHRGKDLPFPVLTNDTYASSLAETKSSTGSTGNSARSFTNNSIERFARACSLIEKFNGNGGDQSPVNYAFGILNAVAQGTHTKWSIVYDISNHSISFRTNGYEEIKTISFNSFDFSCTGTSLTWDMNQHKSGDIASQFLPWTVEKNRALVETSFLESRSQFTVPESAVKETWEYAEGIVCSN